MSDLSQIFKEDFLKECNFTESEKAAILRLFQESEESYKKSCEGQRGLYVDLAEGNMELVNLILRRDLTKERLEKVQHYINEAREYLRSSPASSECKPHWAGVVKRFNSQIEYYRSKGLKVEPVSNPQFESYYKYYQEILQSNPAAFTSS